VILAGGRIADNRFVNKGFGRAVSRRYFVCIASVWELFSVELTGRALLRLTFMISKEVDGSFLGKRRRRILSV